ncbi:MAG: Rrf2 family transcriptional regulator [Deltaproteobacteria bacterium]|nr:Rrf2 family transcriptional regulator [Deltaproteobacteria bacterium]
MRITRWGEYGIHCAAYIAKQLVAGNDKVAATEISESQQIPIDYTRQILQRLKQGGIVETVRGPHGGYKLVGAPEEINLSQILVAAEGDTFEVICETNPLSHDRCGNGTCCSLKPIWYRLSQHINDFLSNYTLKDLLEEQDRGEDLPIKIGALSASLPS